MDFINVTISDVDFVWKSPSRALDGKSGLKIIAACFMIFNWILGTFLYVGLILFERFGGDPMKRGLSNQVKYLHLQNRIIISCTSISAYVPSLLRLDFILPCIRSDKCLLDSSWTGDFSSLFWHLDHFLHELRVPPRIVRH